MAEDKHQLTVIEKGHITGASVFKQLREHILEISAAL